MTERKERTSTHEPAHRTGPSEGSGAWLFYDGDCALCSGAAERWRSKLECRGVQLERLESDRGRRELELEPGVEPDEMKLLLPSGEVLGGGEAVIELAGRFWWSRPAAACARRIPWLRRTVNHLYRKLAENRHCLGGACSLGDRPKAEKDRESAASEFWGYLPLGVAVLAVLPTRAALPGWAFMWLLAYALFFGFKWLTLWWSRERAKTASRLNVLAYLLLWVGLDPEPFLAEDGRSAAGDREATRRPGGRMAGILCLISGMVLLGAAISDGTPPDWLRAWAGMVGIALVLHFGLFRLLAWAWQSVGVPVQPIMDAPVLSRSVRDFWSRRWNRAFRDLSSRALSRYRSRLPSPRWGILLVFFVSGLLHEIVISLPAGGGYGGPTLYFLIQGAALSLEKSGRFRALRSGALERVWALGVVIIPGPLLFHAPFSNEVVLPLLDAIRGVVVRIEVPTLPVLIVAAGLVQLAITAASLLIPTRLNWKSRLEAADPLVRHLFWVYGAFIWLTNLSFGVISVADPGGMASGTRLARLLCGFIAVYWTVRLVLQVRLSSSTDLPREWLDRAGFHALSVGFLFLVYVYTHGMLIGGV